MNSFLFITSPLDQFEIRNLLSLDAPILGNLSISLTSIGLYLTISGYLLIMLNLMATNNNKVVSNSWSISQETIYATVHGIVVNQINEKNGRFEILIVRWVKSFRHLSNLITTFYAKQSGVFKHTKTKKTVFHTWNRYVQHISPGRTLTSISIKIQKYRPQYSKD